MTDERYLIVQAVLAGQLPGSVLTDAEAVQVASDLFDTVIDDALEKLQQNQQLSVFWGEESPTMH